MATTSGIYSSPFLNGKPTRKQVPHCVTLSTLPPLPIPFRSRLLPNREIFNTTTTTTTTNAYCPKIYRNVVAMATGDAPADVGDDGSDALKTIQQLWDKLEDKYAVTSLGFAAIVVLWGSTGMISAIDRLPLVPGLLELVGIGYTGWFTYQNLIFKPDREALLQKIKDSYSEIIGSS